MTVNEARDQPVELRRMVRQGIDLMTERYRDAGAVVPRKPHGSTFKQVAERLIEMNQAEWDEGRDITARLDQPRHRLDAQHVGHLSIVRRHHCRVPASSLGSIKPKFGADYQPTTFDAVGSGTTTLDPTPPPARLTR